MIISEHCETSDTFAGTYQEHWTPIWQDDCYALRPCLGLFSGFPECPSLFVHLLKRSLASGNGSHFSSFQTPCKLISYQGTISFSFKLIHWHSVRLSQVIGRMASLYHSLSSNLVFSLSLITCHPGFLQRSLFIQLLL